MAFKLDGTKFKAWADDGTPLALGKVYTYETGTSTPKVTYTDEDQGTANANPVILDARGEADIYLNGTYKIVVDDANDVTIDTVDPVSDASNLGLGWIEQQDATYVSAQVFTVTGNKTSIFTAGRPVRVLLNTGYVYGYVVSSAYTSLTTVTITSNSSLDATASEAEVSIIDDERLIPLFDNNVPEYDSVASFIADSPAAGVNLVKISSRDAWTLGSGAPSGAVVIYRTNATNASPSRGTSVAASKIGGGDGSGSTTGQSVQSGLLFDSSGNEWDIRPDFRLSDADFGAESDQSTDDSQAVADLFNAPSRFAKLLARKTRHDADIWGEKYFVDSKDLNAKGLRYSIGSLPRFFQKLTDYNEQTSTGIKVMGMGSSVGVGADTDTPATDAPVAKFTEYLDDKFNKLGHISFSFVNESVNGSTLNDGVLNVDSYLSTNNPDIVVLAYGMNDGGVSIYNSGQTYPQCDNLLKTIILKCQQAGADVVVLTTPHPLTTANIFSIASTIPMLYPTASWTLTEAFTYTAATNRITATTSGAFTNSSFGFGLSVGKTITVSSTASNDGTFTIASIDGSGDFITVSETVVDEAAVSSTVKRTNIDPDTEQYPTRANSVVSIDALGLGAGNEIDVSFRHYRVNEAMRRGAIEMGAMVIDVEHYWFEAVYRHGVANLYDGAETVHPNQTGHRQSYWRAQYEAIEALAEAYAHGVQQNTLFPYVVINDAAGNSALHIKELDSDTSIMKLLNTALLNLLELDSATGLNLDKTVDLNAGQVIKFKSGALNRSVKLECEEFTNVGTAQDVATTTTSTGFIVLFGRQGGIGTQMLLHPFSNNVGTLTVGAAIANVGAAVFTSVAASGANIRITPAAANTNIGYLLLEIS